MSDLIDRQAAIDALSMMQGIVAENGVRKGISMAWQQIKDLPSAQRTGRWIPVSERLPNPNEKENDCLVYYLVQNEYGDMMVAAYRGNANGEIWWEQMYAYKPIEDEVIAWMPLPEPYKEEQE